MPCPPLAVRFVHRFGDTRLWPSEDHPEALLDAAHRVLGVRGNGDARHVSLPAHAEDALHLLLDLRKVLCEQVSAYPQTIRFYIRLRNDPALSARVMTIPGRRVIHCHAQQ